MAATSNSLSASGEPAEAPLASARVALRRAALCLGIAVGTLPVLWGALEVTQSRALGAIGFLGVMFASVAGGWFAGPSVYRAYPSPAPRSGLVAVGGLTLFFVHGAMVLLGALAALLSSAGG